MLVREGPYPRTSGSLYVEVVKSVLMFGSETWVVTPCILRAMGVLYIWLTLCISGRIPHLLCNGGWY